MRRLGTLAFLTLLVLVASPTAASAHCHGSVTYGPGGSGDCGKAALWGTLLAAAAWGGAAAMNVLALALDYYREPLFRKLPKAHFENYRPPSERYRPVGRRRLERHPSRDRRRNVYLEQLGDEYEFMYRARELSSAGTHDAVAKFATALAEVVSGALPKQGARLASESAVPGWVGPTVEWTARIYIVSRPLQRVGWRWLNDTAIRIRAFTGLWL
ncbi:hypothetical protein ABN034_29215 [Actinopolymorpha sp. B11F2]|uniref:hypothetical protein n=1 Tax=Actinopolymorpha sp. B11F2 TaxID=3160862 RepID=UPI0032E481A5